MHSLFSANCETPQIEPRLSEFRETRRWRTGTAPLTEPEVKPDGRRVLRHPERGCGEGSRAVPRAGHSPAFWRPLLTGKRSLCRDGNPVAVPAPEPVPGRAGTRAAAAAALPGAPAAMFPRSQPGPTRPRSRRRRGGRTPRARPGDGLRRQHKAARPARPGPLRRRAEGPQPREGRGGGTGRGRAPAGRAGQGCPHLYHSSPRS